jgi:hypothetical protein
VFLKMVVAPGTITVGSHRSEALKKVNTSSGVVPACKKVGLIYDWARTALKMSSDAPTAAQVRTIAWIVDTKACGILAAQRVIIDVWHVDGLQWRQWRDGGHVCGGPSEPMVDFCGQQSLG